MFIYVAMNPMLIIGLFILYLMSKSKGKGTDTNSFTGTEETVTTAPVKNPTNSNGVTTIYNTITKAKAKSIASRLFEIMDATWGTSESDIMTQLQGLNDADFKMISKEFGIKPYNKAFGSDYWFTPATDLELIDWITYEVVEKTNISKLKKWFPNTF